MTDSRPNDAFAHPGVKAVFQALADVFRPPASEPCKFVRMSKSLARELGKLSDDERNALGVYLLSGSKSPVVTMGDDGAKA